MRSVLRTEEKYLLDYVVYRRHVGFLKNVLHSDEHDGNDGYKVRSLYFDTLNDHDFNDKVDGLELRRKIRLRVYSPEDQFAFLEIKQKEGSLQLKRSLKVTRNDAEEIIKGNYQVLQNYEEELAGELYGLMKTYNYVPKTVVEYSRYAFIVKENNIRITFDSNILYSETDYNIFNPKLNLIPAYRGVILEVKYNGFLLGYIKNLIQGIDKSPISISKYCLGRTITNKYIY